MDLKTWLHDNSLTIVAFSRVAGVGVATVHRILAGATPRLDVAMTLSKATRGAVSVAELVGDVYVMRRMTRAGNRLACSKCGQDAHIVLIDRKGRKRLLSSLGLDSEDASVTDGPTRATVQQALSEQAQASDTV